ELGRACPGPDVGCALAPLDLSPIRLPRPPGTQLLDQILDRVPVGHELGDDLAQLRETALPALELVDVLELPCNLRFDAVELGFDDPYPLDLAVDLHHLFVEMRDPGREVIDSGGQPGQVALQFLERVQSRPGVPQPGVEDGRLLPHRGDHLPPRLPRRAARPIRSATGQSPQPRPEYLDHRSSDIVRPGRRSIVAGTMVRST